MGQAALVQGMHKSTMDGPCRLAPENGQSLRPVSGLLVQIRAPAESHKPGLREFEHPHPPQLPFHPPSCLIRGHTGLPELAAPTLDRPILPSCPHVLSPGKAPSVRPQPESLFQNRCGLAVQQSQPFIQLVGYSVGWPGGPLWEAAPPIRIRGLPWMPALHPQPAAPVPPSAECETHSAQPVGGGISV
jgi:hypothetical protein